MTIDQLRAVLKERIEVFTDRAKNHTEYGMICHLNGKVQGTKEALELLDLLDGERGLCPECGGSMGSRLQDGRWRCAGLSSYAVLASENCGCVYQD